MIPPVRRAQLSRAPSCHSQAVSRDAGGSVGAGPMAGASSRRDTGHWEDFPALQEHCAAGPALSGAEGEQWELTQWLLSPGRGDSHQPHREQLAGNSSFPPISLRKSMFCGRGCVLWKRLCPVCRHGQVCASGLKCLFPSLLMMALLFFSLKHYFVSKQSFRFKSNSKAPQYISKGLKPDGAQITCFLFLPQNAVTKNKKIQLGFCPQSRVRVFSQNSQNLSSESVSLFWPASACMRGWKISGGNVKAC